MQTRDDPDELTPREREVFDLVRLGLTNEEIAARLGISLDGAKYHVSQILSKLGVSTREEAAAAALHATTTNVAEAFQPRRRRWWAALPLVAKAAGVAVVLAVVGGLGVMAWGVVKTSEDGDGGVPNQPANVRVVGSSLEWDDESDNEDGFRTYANCEGGLVGLSGLLGTPDVPANTTRLSPTSLRCPALGVAAFNAAGESEISWSSPTLTVYGTLVRFDQDTLSLAIRVGGAPAEMAARLTGKSLVELAGAALDPNDGPRVGEMVLVTMESSGPVHDVERLVLDAGPRIGDHWHAPYQFFACGEKQPNAPTWESGVHTHGDGIIHIHPFQTFEEGSGASLVKWFEYGGGLLTDTEINMPGSSKTFSNGDLCPNGKPGEVQVFVTRVGENSEQRLEGGALQAYIPHDGERIRMVFGPPEEPVTHTPEPSGEPTPPVTPLATIAPQR